MICIIKFCVPRDIKWKYMLWILKILAQFMLLICLQFNRFRMGWKYPLLWIKPSSDDLLIRQRRWCFDPACLSRPAPPLSAKGPVSTLTAHSTLSRPSEGELNLKLQTLTSSQWATSHFIGSLFLVTHLCKYSLLSMRKNGSWHQLSLWILKIQSSPPTDLTNRIFSFQRPVW